MLTQVGEVSGLDVNIGYGWNQADLHLRGRNCGHMIVKLRTRTQFQFPAPNLVAVVVLSHVQLSATRMLNVYFCSKLNMSN